MPSKRRTRPSPASRPLHAADVARMLRKGLERLAASFDDRRASPDPERVHQFRRHIRHMRVFLDVYVEWGRSGRARVLRDRIKHMQHALGPLRDNHVRLDALREQVKHRPELDALLRRARKEEREGSVAVRASLAGTELKEITAIRNALKRRPPGTRPRTALQRVLAEYLRQLRDRWKAMDRRHLRSMHRVRIILRRLAYLIGSFAEFLPPAITSHLALLKRMAARLGRIHDLQTLVEWCSSDLMNAPMASRPATIAFLDRSIHLLDRRVASFLREHPRVVL